jgi:2-methylisocitrate lyase-like PEP mutase family enzyme
MAHGPDQDLRDILTPGAAVLLPGAANALTARVIEDAGFSALYVTGAGIANTYLGMPDIGLTTATEIADHVWRIRDAVSIPLIVDADTGFGNALNVQRTVRMLERAGAGAIQLEDQVFPKRCGHFEGKDVISASEMVKKIQAAVEARQRASTLILARDRCPRDRRAERRPRARGDVPRGWCGSAVRRSAPDDRGAGRHPVACAWTAHLQSRVRRQDAALTTRPIGRDGIRGILYANAALQAAVKAMVRVLGHLHGSGSLAGMEEALVSFEERQRVINHPRFKALEERFTSGERPPIPKLQPVEILHRGGVHALEVRAVKPVPWSDSLCATSI